MLKIEYIKNNRYITNRKIPSIFDILPFSAKQKRRRNTKHNVNPLKLNSSFFIFCCKNISDNARTKPMLHIIEPNPLLTHNSALPFIADIQLTNNSGAVVAKLKSVIPINCSPNPVFKEILIALSISKSPLLRITNIPNIKHKTKNTICILYIILLNLA